jgi:hypothetical protein
MMAPEPVEVAVTVPGVPTRMNTGAVMVMNAGAFPTTSTVSDWLAGSYSSLPGDWAVTVHRPALAPSTEMPSSLQMSDGPADK